MVWNPFRNRQEVDYFAIEDEPPTPPPPTPDQGQGEPKDASEIHVLAQRIEQLEQSLPQRLAEALQVVLRPREPEPEPQPQSVPDSPKIHPFYEQVMDYGEEAFIQNPRVNAWLDSRLYNMRAYESMRTELGGKYPEVYDPQSDVGKTRIAIKEQFRQLGVTPAALESRLFEEFITSAALGKHLDSYVKSSTEKTRMDPTRHFVEGSGTFPGGSEPLSLSPEEAHVADRMGIPREEYAKSRETAIKLGLIDRSKGQTPFMIQ